MTRYADASQDVLESSLRSEPIRPYAEAMIRLSIAAMKTPIIREGRIAAMETLGRLAGSVRSSMSSSA